jgi:hypothetical protein
MKRSRILSIAGLMTITTWELLKESIGRFALHTHIEPAVHELVPGKLLSADQAHPVGAAVREAVAAAPGLRLPSNLLVRSTAEGLFVSFDCLAEPGLSVSASHTLTHTVSEGIRKKLPNVLEVAVRVKPE